VLLRDQFAGEGVDRLPMLSHDSRFRYNGGTNSGWLRAEKAEDVGQGPLLLWLSVCDKVLLHKKQYVSLCCDAAGCACLKRQLRVIRASKVTQCRCHVANKCAGKRCELGLCLIEMG
jgi:hypothetical protein